MRRSIGLGAAAVLAATGVASALPTLQFDVNSFNAQAYNTSNNPSAFGGLTHSGSVRFTVGSGYLNGLFIRTTPNGPFNSAGFSGFTMTGFTGQINLSSGQVTGGNLTIALNNGDNYTAQITPNIGSVTTFVGGGFKLEGLTRQGLFNDSVFGNVDVSPWFNAQGGGGLLGSFLQFNFNPSATGQASSDMDLFVDVVPLPPAAWAGMATLAGAMVIRRIRRR